MDRRSFLRHSALIAAGTGLIGVPGCSSAAPKPYKVGGKARMQLSWEPYELQLRHTFTVATYSRTTTPDVQVRIDYDGFTGYGEASMPPYLGQTVESVCSFLERSIWAGSQIRSNWRTFWRMSTAFLRGIRLLRLRWTLLCTTWSAS